MTAFTSKASGNWSASGATTWTQAGTPGIGDTITIQSGHQITVDIDETIGTSPNDTTTKVIQITNGKIIIAAGKTLTIRGNWGESFLEAETLLMNAGSAIVFDASSSGGTPSYVMNCFFNKWTVNGTSASRCAISAVAGRTFTVSMLTAPVLTLNYCNFTRMAASTFQTAGDCTDYTITNCIVDSCGKITSVSNNTTTNYQINGNSFTNGTDGSAVDINIQIDGAFTSGLREFKNNSLDGNLSYFGVGFTAYRNIANSVSASATTGNWASFSESVIVSAPGTGNGNFIGRVTAIDRVYFLQGGANPHFLAATAHDRNLTVSNCLFEHTANYGIDNGDCIFPYCVPTFKVTVSNCIVLPGPDGYTAGTLGTHYSSAILGSTFTDAARTVEYLHNTVCVYSPDDASQGGVDVAESQVGHAGEVTLFKSNLFWGPVASRGLKLSRINGTTNAILTASGADYNGSYNLTTGDNGLGYNDRDQNLNLWTGAAATGGDAAAQGVDAHGVTANPNFVDSTRNLASWCLARGYGAQTTAAAITALKADTTRITDAINYVQAGFAPLTNSFRNAGHDGVTIGAVEYAGPTITGPWANVSYIDAGTEGRYVNAQTESRYIDA